MDEISQGIKGSIELLKESGLQNDVIKEMIMKKYELSQERVDNYMKEYM